MSIRQQVQDASFLAQNGRHIGALTILMVAIAASARKCFPKETKSIKNPTKKMKDSEAFTQFLGGRIRRLLFGHYNGPEFGNSGILVDYKGKQYDIAYVLYKFYRCELIHEGGLPEDVEFSPPNNSEQGELNIGTRKLRVSISTGNKMVLDHGWIDLLISAIVQARCNGPEFGIKHFDLVLRSNMDENAFQGFIVARHLITPGRFQILKRAVRLISPELINTSGDDLVISFR